MTRQQRIGRFDEFVAWTKDVVREPSRAKGAPKLWFESGKAAARAVSAEALVKLLSADNIGLLRTIRARRPDSMRALAAMTGRKESNLSRTMRKLALAGLVRLVPGGGRRMRPVVIARKVRLEIDFSAAA